MESGEHPKSDLKKKKRKRVLFWLIVSFIVLTVVTGNYGAYQIFKIKRQVSELEKEIDMLKEDKKRLQEERDQLKNDLEAIERVAREKYGMTKPGEQVFQMIPKTTKEK
ncbi:MAG: septum formation initiator family protein [Bacteroidetes bacterium]|nr:septum formation initiator family protein [Bacteroidota bacterium]